MAGLRFIIWTLWVGGATGLQFVMLSLSGFLSLLEPVRAQGCGSFAPRWEGLGALSAAGKRRQYLNLYGPSELPLKILLVSRAPIDQHRARLDHCVETRIGARQAGESEGFSDRLGLDLLFGDARCGLGPCPVMKGNRHHCVTLKHALRPFRGG